MKLCNLICGVLLLFSVTASRASDIDRQYHLLAHRGGVTESGIHPENSLAALDAAIERGYSGVEIDVRQSKDGKLFLYHNRTFERDYDSKARAEDLTWAEIQRLRPLREDGKVPVSMEEYCNYCKGKLSELMIDIKVDKPSLAFYQEVERILTETGFLESSYFIGHGEYFLGKAKITMLIREKDEFFKKYGDKTKDYYFLFAGIDEINSRLIQWCEKEGIQIMACVNRPYREPLTPENIENAGKDLEWLKSWGVKYFQIDSDYDRPFRAGK
ncbi:glycerophosphodiester phosphodiesterase family protein [uncultured Parabacteroides sp.]|uniref:glycerophosphodiester phosphodiesterase n=1 Tax=uncultured Parabacteroides sp. TaxID=512312 RepID=UPI00262E10F4|nr:glycerophosphodiester phosphodiesterase family protein [uncultured Parabacteroides sp.]